MDLLFYGSVIGSCLNQ